jgi:hypothetical protein
MKAFFEVYFDFEKFPDMWNLTDPINENGNVLEANALPTHGSYIGSRIVKVHINTRYPGRPMDFNFGYGSLLVVKTHVADLIEAHGGRIQRYPVTLEPTGETEYEVIFALDAPKGLIDISRANEYEFYDADVLGADMRYRVIAPAQKGMLYKCYPHLYIYPEKVGDMEFYKPWEYDTLIISETLKEDFEAANVTGIKYTQVS